MKDLGIKSIGVLSVASEYGTSGVKSFKTLMGDSIKVVTEEVYQVTDTDYTGQIVKILNAKPEGVLIYGQTTESALAIKQFRRSGYEGFIFGPESLGVPDIIKVAGEAADNTVFGSSAVVPASPADAVSAVEKKMLEDFIAAYGAMPVSDVVYRGYDGIMLIARAMNTAADMKPESIREAFLKIKGYELTGGNYDFTDGSGDGLKTARTYIVHGGKNVLYETWKANR
jgi:branched-chain amino acid transport system substrate-binding protein